VIFLSYSWEDSQAARSLYRLLQQSGFETWIDFEQLDLRSDIVPQLETAVLASHALLFVDTPSARLSRWTQFEKAIAQSAKIPVWRIDATFQAKGALVGRSRVCPRDDKTKAELQAAAALTKTFSFSADCSMRTKPSPSNI